MPQNLSQPLGIKDCCGVYLASWATLEQKPVPFQCRVSGHGKMSRVCDQKLLVFGLCSLVSALVEGGLGCARLVCDTLAGGSKPSLLTLLGRRQQAQATAYF